MEQSLQDLDENGDAKEASTASLSAQAEDQAVGTGGAFRLKVEKVRPSLVGEAPEVPIEHPAASTESPSIDSPTKCYLQVSEMNRIVD